MNISIAARDRAWRGQREFSGRRGLCADTVRQLKAQLAPLKQDCGDTDEKYPELLKRLQETP
ncbi:MAG: hypothetical protein FJ272_02570 [Planctomycetes bacterium]|nr:hypothetical protein [Planctomycetota bacterium]